MVGVHDKHSLRAPPVAGIDESALLAGILHQTLDRGGIRADNADDAVGVDHIAETDVQQLHGVPSRLLNVLDLLTNLLNFGFQLHHQPGDGNILTFGADGIGLAV